MSLNKYDDFGELVWVCPANRKRKRKPKKLTIDDLIKLVGEALI
jgi:hypothetical protein